MPQKYFTKIVSKPYPYLFSPRRNIIIAVVLGLLVYGINMIGIGDRYIYEDYIVSKPFACLFASLTTFCSILFVVEILPRLFFDTELKENWTVGKECLLILCILFVIALSNNIMSFVISKEHSSFNVLYNFFNASFYVVLIGTVPTILIIWLNYTLLLRENLREISFYNKHLEARIKNHTDSLSDCINIPTNNKNEALQLDISTFLFAKAEGNYVDIFTRTSKGLGGETYRLTIQKLEIILSNYPFILKTHRSYIVNMKNISTTSGNARNYRLHFEGIAYEVPVSRNKFQTFKEAFSIKT